MSGSTNDLEPGALPDGVRAASLPDAIIPLVALVALIASSLAIYGLDALDGPVQVALILSCMIAGLIGCTSRCSARGSG
ncbi:MAG TPA: hypothetical protein VFN21_08785 [Acidimicrobiales bacterium]|nr:hypothetical protein [Acidimicrobiales bacterium]